jgi:ABC-2 type transport system ATP-binding protein
MAVNHVTLQVPTGSFYGLVGPNGAGKTTLLSLATGLLRPESGTSAICGTSVWENPRAAKQLVGIMPDGLRLFDRLNARQLLEYTGRLRGMDKETVGARASDLLQLMDLDGTGAKLVADFSAGMTKKITLAAALIHAPRLLVLDEPFEAVDPVSAANIRDVLASYVQGGGTVIVSSHVMDLVQRMCDHVAIMANGSILTAGTVDEVRGDKDLESTFIDLVGGRHEGGNLTWLQH